MFHSIYFRTCCLLLMFSFFFISFSVEIDEKKNRSVFREFQLEPTGAILEIFDKRNATYTKRSIFNKEMLQGSLLNQGETDREEGDSPEGEGGKGDDDGENSRRSPRSASSGHK